MKRLRLNSIGFAGAAATGAAQSTIKMMSNVVAMMVGNILFDIYPPLYWIPDEIHCSSKTIEQPPFVFLNQHR
jgi:hypothetical protein